LAGPFEAPARMVGFVKNVREELAEGAAVRKATERVKGVMAAEETNWMGRFLQFNNEIRYRHFGINRTKGSKIYKSSRGSFH